jgi:diguanylate cyclase (GGDEF)-like protein
MTEAYRLLAKEMQEKGFVFPLHLGVTEAGNGDGGRIKSAVGISVLLSEGIGNTIRVSLTEAPVNEIPESLIIRALSYDYIKKPINKTELNVRINALKKTYITKKELIKTAICDELTGLYNRKYLHHRLDAEISRAKRYGTNLSCLLLDIDYFKIVNDMYGYDWGDILLRKIAQMLSALVRKEDVLTRYGDEEFIIILPETTEQQAMIFAERFRKDVEKMEFIPANEEERHPITISGGISSFPCMEEVDENANTLIRYAEHALYNAKQSGKNKIVEFSKMNLGC